MSARLTLQEVNEQPFYDTTGKGVSKKKTNKMAQLITYTPQNPLMIPPFKKHSV